MNSINYILLLITILACSLSLAQEPIPVVSDTGYVSALYPRESHFAVLPGIIPDPQNDLTLDQLRRLATQSASRLEPGLPPEQKHCWLRFSLQNDTDEAREWFIEKQHADSAFLYIFKEDKLVVSQKGGLRLPFSEWDIQKPNGRYTYFSLRLNPGETIDAFMDVTFSQETSNFYLTFIPATRFNTLDRNKQYAQGLFFGILIALILHNLIIYLADRDKSYMLFTLYLCSALSFWFIFYYYAYQFLWPNSPWWNARSYPISFSLHMVTFFLFGKVFLNLKSKYPLWNHVISAIIAILLIILTHFLYRSIDTENIRAAIRVFLALATPACIIGFFMLIYLSIRAVMQGYRPARYYLAASVVPILGGSALLLQDLQLLPTNFFTVNSTQISVAMQSILFSLGLGDRINLMGLELAQKELEKATTAEKLIQAEKGQEQTQEINRLKSRFFANISHEFRTPLTLIIGPLEDMLAGKARQTDINKLSIMHRNAKRLLRLINQLLDLSRLETGNVKLRLTKGKFISFLRGLVMSFSSLAESRGVKFSLQCDVEDKNPTIANFHYDRTKFEEIVSNLLSNAFKFTPDHGSIDVTCRILHAGMNPVTGQSESTIINHQAHIVDLLEIRIRDTGKGIESEEIPLIFDRFYQTDNAKLRSAEGSGIGLSLVKELTELHGGRISVTSEPDHGTEFVLLFPVEVDGYQSLDSTIVSAEPIESERRPEPEAGNGNNVIMKAGMNEHSAPEQNDVIILIVEDNEDVRQYIREQLESHYQITEAENGADGFDTAAEIVPDLIISDVMMPKVDGYQLCDRLKTDQRTSHIPVILLTAKAGEESKIIGLETGADDYLTKPFNARELLTRVRNLIDLRRKLRARFTRASGLMPSEITTTSTDQRFLERALEVVEIYIADESFSVETLCKEIGMSRPQLHRKLRALTDQSTGQFIQTIRLRRAAAMIVKDAGTIAEIAFRVGFGDPSYFTKCFRKQFGCKPSDYRLKETK